MIYKSSKYFVICKPERNSNLKTKEMNWVSHKDRLNSLILRETIFVMFFIKSHRVSREWTGVLPEEQFVQP